VGVVLGREKAKRHGTLSGRAVAKGGRTFWGLYIKCQTLHTLPYSQALPRGENLQSRGCLNVGCLL
jgi:hypothetical protein